MTNYVDAAARLISEMNERAARDEAKHAANRAEI